MPNVTSNAKEMTDERSWFGHEVDQKWLTKKDHDTATETSQTVPKTKEIKVEGSWFWNDAEPK
eukprot:15361222-Ditylum_brightwellii.AAC.1